MSDFNEQLKSLPPEKLQHLLQRLKPGVAGRVASAPRPTERRPFRVGVDPDYALEIKTPGVLDSLQFKTRPRYELAPDGVEIEVYAASINFRDVMLALGMYPLGEAEARPRFGLDYSGVVTRVGPAVTCFRPGDEVMGIAKSTIGTFSRYTVSFDDSIIPKPSHLSFQEAAALPGVLLTAYYALCDVGRMSKGERVLIHAAAGGVGLAAIQLAQWVGAEIYATAGTPEKRAYLESLGIRHIMDSRSLDFIDETLRLTDNEGVDLILNSLPGKAITEGIKLLRTWGRFLELGRKDLIEDTTWGMSVFEQGIVFATVNIGFRSSEMQRRVYGNVTRLLEEKVFKPLPIVVYPIADVAEAFSFMTTGKHMGKLVLTMKDQPVDVVVD